MNIIGRRKEIDRIEQCLYSKRPEFMVVYGRRRVGKTYLIKEYFNNTFSFYATGIMDANTHGQLKAFNESLKFYGDKEKKAPKDWFEAFGRLRMLLEKDDVVRDPVSKKRVVFLDEVPWMDTARSDFKSALEFFWNGWASSCEDILLIVCGSATSWIISNILNSRGGFYNRVTNRLWLMPFTLGECEEYFKSNGMIMTRKQVIESYMVFGGIPYYLNLLDRRQSLIQNIDSLVINSNGQLHYEFDHIFASLFKKPVKHIAVINALINHKTGMLRTELALCQGLTDGAGLTKVLGELEECGFIQKSKNISKDKSGFLYRIIDPFVLFSHTFLKEKGIDSWTKFYKTAAYYSWRGLAFETVCMWHVPQIKAALGISGVSTNECSWKSKQKKGGAQIDLLLDRKDDVINICEMKFSDEEYEIDANYEEELWHKVEVYRTEMNSSKAIHITLVSASGLKKNEHFDAVQNLITGDDLFV